MDIDFLKGEWVGEGTGQYPTITPFRYREMLTFSSDGRAFLRYEQLSHDLLGDRAMHVESGYFRTPSPGVVEAMISQPIGFSEVLLGTVEVLGDLTVMVLESSSVGRSPTAKEVVRTRRSFRVQGHLLSYVFEMEGVGQPMSLHLESSLHRLEESRA